MATLNQDRIDKRKKKRYIIWLCITVLEVFLAVILVDVMDQILSSVANNGTLGLSQITISFGQAIKCLFLSKNHRLFFLLTQLLYLSLYIYCMMSVRPEISSVDTSAITDDISIPVPAGNGQHGSERLLTEAEKEELFDVFYFSGKEKLKGKGGVVVGMTKGKDGEKIYYISTDKHTMIIGASGSGKSRRVILQTIWLQILSGISVIISDVKGEIYYYTKEFAEKHGYKTYALDLRNPKKSVHYNFLQPVLDAFAEGDIAKGIDYTWDLVSVLVGEQKGEPLWYNGETAAIAASILIVALDAPEEFRNLTNVYYFLAYMCEADPFGNMPLNMYLEGLDDTHPAKGVFAMAKIAADKTRSSFFTSALGTLRLFTNPNIAEMTSKSDFNLKDISREKSILYMMIPDEKKTMYPLVSILVTQLYVAQVELANECGLKLPVPTDYDLDELGNFPYIPVFGNILSAGRSRGVRANAVIQDFQQLESKYKDDFKNIKTNCQVKLYLKSDDPDTLKLVSETLGKYTVEVSSASTSVSDGKKNDMNYSSSASLVARSLLEPAEVKRIKSPYTITMLTGEYGAVNELPDLSEYRLNELYGLGDEEHNTKLVMEREKARAERTIPPLHLWGIWNSYKGFEDTDETEGEQDADEDDSFSFLE